MDNEEEVTRIKKLQTLQLFHNVALECRLGWFELLFGFGQKVTSFCNHNDLPIPSIIQVKEKFGALRIYLKFNPDIDVEYVTLIRKWAKHTEGESSNVCEQCGSEGVLVVDGGRWHTACENHRSPDAMSASDFMEKQKKQERKEKNKVF